MAPASPSQQSLHVLARRDEERLVVDLGQPSEAEPAQPVPDLGLGEERLDPDLALAHRPRELLGLGVAAYALQVRLVYVAADPPPAWRGRALGTAGTRRAGARRGRGDPALGGVALGQEAQRLPARA